MPITAFDIQNRKPYDAGQAFGEVGAYEQIDGVATVAVDPNNLANALITDLGLAPRDEDGRVRFEADLSILQPVDSSAGPQRLLVELPNRGRRRIVANFNGGPPLEPARDVHPGDGFLFRHGFTVVSIGWQHDVYRSDALMGVEAPLAMSGDKSVSGQTMVEFRPNEVQTTYLLANRIHQPYPAADLDEAGAELTVREWEDGPHVVIPRDKWQFGRETDAGVEPDAEYIYMADGFQPGKYYYVTYTTNRAPVAGVGHLAVRDVSLFLKTPSDDNPTPGEFAAAYVWGVSQTGRMLREYIYLGLNVGEDGQSAYDGILPHVAGARRGQFNFRFAQPSDQAMPTIGHKFPFADESTPDPLTESTGGLLDRLRSQGDCPKVIYTNSSAEYWRGDASFAHIDPATGKDIPGAPEARIYHFASAQHGAGHFPQQTVSPADKSEGAYPSGVMDYTPLLRASLINMDRWVIDGIEPPTSSHPRIDDGTAVRPKVVIDGLGAIPGVRGPDPDRLFIVRTVDMGPDSDRGVGRWPAIEGETYTHYVAAVDEDGNEVAGIRMPDVSVPVATHTGWNRRGGNTGSPEQQIPMAGWSIFFPMTGEERDHSGDPRRSIEERYLGRDAYLDAVRAAAEELIGSGYALDEDMEMMVDIAAERWDHVMRVEEAIPTR
jgi:hypothetical protein